MNPPSTTLMLIYAVILLVIAVLWLAVVGLGDAAVVAAKSHIMAAA